MSIERDQNPPSPDDLLRIKDDMMQRWQQLPPEHQATMTLVLFQHALEGEYGNWLRSAMRVMEQRDAESPFRFLPVVRLTHSHLDRANLTDAEIAQLNEEDLHYISHELVRHYTNDVFWEELEYLAHKVLDEKPEP